MSARLRGSIGGFGGGGAPRPSGAGSTCQPGASSAVRKGWPGDDAGAGLGTVLQLEQNRTAQGNLGVHEVFTPWQPDGEA